MSGERARLETRSVFPNLPKIVCPKGRAGSSPVPGAFLEKGGLYLVPVQTGSFQRVQDKEKNRQTCLENQGKYPQSKFLIKNYKGNLSYVESKTILLASNI